MEEFIIKCQICGTEGPESSFPRRWFKKGRYELVMCRNCRHALQLDLKKKRSEKLAEHKKKQQEYYQIHKDERREYARTYFQTSHGRAIAARAQHRRRTREVWAEASLTGEQWKQIIEQQNKKCNICGAEFTDTLKPTRDHIIPVSEGGGLTFDNVQALCRSCNSRKSDRVNPQFLNNNLMKRKTEKKSK